MEQSSAICRIYTLQHYVRGPKGLENGPVATFETEDRGRSEAKAAFEAGAIGVQLIKQCEPAVYGARDRPEIVLTLGRTPRS
jgi:hypothetical protein